MRTTIVIIFVTLGVSAYGMGPGMGREDDDWDGHSRPSLVRLGLNDTQIQAVNNIWTRRIQAGRQARADLEVKKAEIARALVPTDPDMNVVRRLLREVVDLEYQLRLNMMEGELEVRRVVGEEIWVKMVRSRERSMMSFSRGPRQGPMKHGQRNDGRNVPR